MSHFLYPRAEASLRHSKTPKIIRKLLCLKGKSLVWRPPGCKKLHLDTTSRVIATYCNYTILYKSHYCITLYLVGGLEHDFTTFHILGISSSQLVIIPTDEVIFFRGVGIPPTRYSCNHPRSCSIS